MHPKIKIANPLPGEATHLGYPHARRLVRRGAAVWIANEPAIRIVRRTPDNALAYDRAQLSGRLEELRTQLRKIPFNGEVEKLLAVRKHRA